MDVLLKSVQKRAGVTLALTLFSPLIFLQSQRECPPQRTNVMMPLLRPTMMLVVNGSGCLRQALSCGAGAWALAAATSDVIHPVSFAIFFLRSISIFGI